MRAMASGVPVVAYDVGGLAEPIERYGAGRVVPAGDVEALTRAVREILDDPVARRMWSTTVSISSCTTRPPPASAAT